MYIRTIITKQANFRHICPLSQSRPHKSKFETRFHRLKERKEKERIKQDAEDMDGNPLPLQSICKRSLIAAQMKLTPWALSTGHTQALTRNNKIHPDRWNPTSQGLSSDFPSGSTYCLDCGTIREQLGHTADLCQAACQ